MSLKTYCRQIDRERALYDTLSKRSELHDPSITVDGLLSICEEIEPSQFLGMGGFFFELFILRFGMEKHRKIILDVVNNEEKRCRQMTKNHCTRNMP